MIPPYIAASLTALRSAAKERADMSWAPVFLPLIAQAAAPLAPIDLRVATRSLDCTGSDDDMIVICVRGSAPARERLPVLPDMPAKDRRARLALPAAGRADASVGQGRFGDPQIRVTATIPF